MRPCHNYFLSFHIQNKVFHFTPLTQYIIVFLDNLDFPVGLQDVNGIGDTLTANMDLAHHRKP